jgi:hypothetical protein
MLQALGDAIDNLDIGVDLDTLAEAIRLRSRLDAVIATAVGAIDNAQAYVADHAVTMPMWLRAYGGLTGGAAARLTHLGRRVHQLPALGEAWRTGALRPGQVDAVVANVTDRVVDRFAEQQHDLVAALVPLEVHATVTAMRFWRAYAEAELDPDPAGESDRELYASRTLDGRRDLRGHLDVEGGEILATALQLADNDDPARPVPARRADALIDICRFFLTYRDHPASSRHVPHLNLIVDTRDGHATTIDATPVPDEVVSRLACDSLLRRVTTDGSAVLHYGRSTRTAPPPLWNAVVVRDRHCRFPDCDMAPQYCQAHHVIEWDHGGITAIDNLCLLCTRHHAAVHKKGSGWRLKLLPDGELHITAPDGTTRTTRPPGPHLPTLWPPAP